jgi:predicted unusual protein kinase regulating ubiquinone biosynthesis (AarF/ABC1/UbiB family)
MARPGLRDITDIPALVRHLADSLRRELDFTQEAANMERMREVLRPYDRLAVPRLHPELCTERLLVMEEIVGVPISRAPDDAGRREAARQLLDAYFRQVLYDGFFHADPHPGNLLWADGRICFLDLGMVGELDGELRRLLVVLLLAFSRGDPRFLAEVVVMLSEAAGAGPVDLDALEREFADFIPRFRAGSLREIQLGPMLEGLTRIAARAGLRLPAALALTGKAFGQMQTAVAQLDPALDPFSVASDFLLRGVRERLLEQVDPERLYYDSQKLRLRAARLIEAFERSTGARPGPGLQVELAGTAAIQESIRQAGHRLALASAAGGAAAALAAWAAARSANRAASGAARRRRRARS